MAPTSDAPDKFSEKLSEKAADHRPENKLGNFLRDRRKRLDPAVFGFGGRRRTPGLRREEVAQRSNISPTWYTWLEQGRGGAPSADVLDRLATGLMLTEPERAHLFVLGRGHPPEARYKPVEGVTPRLQRVLDALENSPAIIKTATWDVVAWNRAAAVMLTDYSLLAPEDRNILRIIFGNAQVRSMQADWDNVTRLVVGAFRVDVARAGADAAVEELVDELCRTSPDFAALWQDTMIVTEGEGESIKRLHHPELGSVAMEFSSFAVEGRSDLGMIVYNPVVPADAERLRELIRQWGD